ncbi:MAG TPA: methylated-DNA--[protein]-cysteine S-methyltransferase [Planctomycetota bacterium]|nr:methylated-DNA--[protein]-cysteine S-methyltransferase [Planctomycetota bacterium]
MNAFSSPSVIGRSKPRAAAGAATFAGDAARRRAIATRDRRADGRFVFAVTSTGVYCRPSCPSRRPRPDRVRFFDDAAAAEAAGFRACRRCRPAADDPRARVDAAVRRACDLLASDDAPRWSDLAARLGVGATYLRRRFQATVGVAPHAFAAAARASRLRSALARGDDVLGAGLRAGYRSPGRMYAAAGTALGMPPATFRAGGAGAVIRWSVRRCAYGVALAAATTRGLCAVELADDADAALAALRARFPKATFEKGGRDARRLAAAAVAAFDDPVAAADLPLDVRATAFQARVWAELRRIPRGATRTYAEVAARLDAPGAARAVARACAGNPLAVLTPCHRVVRGDGRLAGYRWGAARKAELLRREGARPS